MRQTMMGSAGTASRSTTRNLRPRVEGLEGRTLLSAGDLDLSFGGTGTVVRSVGATVQGNSNYASDLAIQTDLKTVEVGPITSISKGSYHMDAAVVRYRMDGAPDTTFGTNGQVIVPFEANNWSGYSARPHAFSVAIQPDGKILIAGNSNITYGKGKQAVTRSDLKLVRLNANGSIDTTFNGTGAAILDFPQAGNVFACGVAVQSDGRIVVSGSQDAVQSVSYPANGLGFLAARWTPTGQLDTTFGPAGRGYVSRPTGGSGSLALDPADRILIGGEDNDPTTGGQVGALVRYTQNGLIDNSFGGDGEVLLAEDTLAGLTGVDFQSTGQIVACGALPATEGVLPLATVIRFNSANGSLDTSFGNAGYLTDPEMGAPRDLVVQPDDKVLMVGLQRIDNQFLDNVYKIDRVLSTGVALDPSFGSSGTTVVTFAAPAYYTFPATIAIGSDGKITIAGLVRTSTGTGYAFGTARLQNDIGTAALTAPSLPRMTSTVNTVARVVEDVSVLIADSPQSGPMPFVKKFRARR